jgi:hypothetical protein
MGGLGAGGGAGAEEEVPPPEGIPALSNAYLAAENEALRAEIDALKAAIAEKGREPPQREKGQ